MLRSSDDQVSIACSRAARLGRLTWGLGLFVLLCAWGTQGQEATPKPAAQAEPNAAEAAPPEGTGAGASAAAAPAADAADAADATAAAPPPAGPPPAQPFYQHEPYDVITLDQANDSLVLKVLPLELPDRQLPELSKRVGKLQVRLLDRRAEEYEVLWRHIAQVELFEQLVLKEAQSLAMQAAQLGRGNDPAAALRKFDEAYDYFRWLLNFHSQVEGLTKAVQDYLYLNSGTLFLIGTRYEADAAVAPDEAQAASLKKLAYQNFAQAFAVLEELYTQDAGYAFSAGNTVTAAMERVGDRLISWYARSGDFVATRRLLQRLERQYEGRLQLAQTWRERLIAAASARREAANAHLQAGRFPEARAASSEMLKIWPQVSGGRELVLEIARRYPLVSVGVSRPVVELDPGSMEDFAARRAGQLVYPMLVEYRERGPEGGRYASPFGQLQQSDDRTELIFDLRAEPDQPAFTGYDLSSNLLAVADPSSARYEPSWARLMAGLRVEDVMRVRVQLRQPHVLPQSMLRIPFRLGEAIAARYDFQQPEENEARFEPLGQEPEVRDRRPVIVERYFDKPRAAIEALRKGKIDMIDRLLPAEAWRLQQDPDLRVGTYSFPSLFLLAPNTSHPYLANRTFRRAITYAINREVILHKGLLDDRQVEGSRVISAPLPAGINQDDPSAYAYDQRIEPYPYDPVMAAILMGVTAQQLGALADQRQEPAPELGELVLAHPAGELPRFIARQIQLQLEVVEIRCSLRELPPGQIRVADDNWDLLLMEICMLEPLVDLPRLLGEGGVIPCDDPYVNLALRRLDQAENWKAAREHLYELHRQLHNDLTVIPLWQMSEFFAYHSGVQGVSERPVNFYDDVDSWRVIPPEHED